MKRDHVTSQVRGRQSTPVPDGGLFFNDDLPFSAELPYFSASCYLRQQFGQRLFRVPIDAGFSCPNRDGHLATGGCAFCSIDGFRPFASRPEKSLSEQINHFLPDCRRRFPKASGFLVYFQPFSNTYGPAARLSAAFEEVLTYPEALGIIVSTRPDCLEADMVALLTETAQRTWLQVELGVQSTSDTALTAMGRGHTWDCSRRAIELLKANRIRIAAHLLLATPWETRKSQIAGAARLSALGIDAVKLHHLQILIGSGLSAAPPPEGWRLPDLGAYACLIAEFLAHLDGRIVVDRLMTSSPRRLLIAPRWGVGPREARDRIIAEMKQRGLRQGILAGNHS